MGLILLIIVLMLNAYVYWKDSHRRKFTLIDHLVYINVTIIVCWLWAIMMKIVG